VRLDRIQTMNSGSDPFGFDVPRPQSSPRPITVVAEPGQEVRIVVADATGAVPGIYTDTRGSPRPSPDTRGSPRPSPDTRGSPRPSPDTRGSPRPSPDSLAVQAFGFASRPQTYSPRPLTIVAQAGQEVRIVVPDETGAVPGIYADTRGSPRPSPDTRGSPRPSPDRR